MSKSTYAEIIVTLCVSLFFGFAASTHFLAWNYGMQDALGIPFYIWQPLSLFHFYIPFYNPFLIFVWLWQWGIHMPFARESLIAGGTVSVSCLALWGVGKFRQISLELRKDKFGQDAWGKESDLKKSGLLSEPPRGTILGRWGRKLISFNGDQHQLVTGSSGSGKTAGPVISSLLTCRTSVLAIDPKRTLYGTTAQWRSTIGSCFYFDPTHLDSVRYNPLSEIVEESEISQAQNIASILVDASGIGDTQSPIWPIKAADLLTGLILYCIHHLPKSQQTLTHIRHLLANEEDTYTKMSFSTHTEVKRVGSIMLPLADKIRQSISVTAQSTLDVFADPLVAQKTSISDFKISDLVCNEKPCSFYLQVRASEARRLRPLQRIIMTQIKRAMMHDIKTMPDGREKQHRLTMVLEEFPALGKDEDFEYDLRQFREYGMTAVIFCQSILDIEAIYGRDQTILDNCHVVVIFAASNPRSLHDISILLGRATEKKVSTSRPRWFAGIFSGNQSTHHQRRPLMDEGEIRSMNPNEQLIFVNGSPPFRTKKIRWFEHARLSKRGTNLHKNAVAPGQSPSVLALLQKTIADKPPQEIIVVRDSKPTELHERLRVVLKSLQWSHRKAAKSLFPDIGDSTARHWIAGTREMPDWAKKIVEEFLSEHEEQLHGAHS